MFVYMIWHYQKHVSLHFPNELSTNYQAGVYQVHRSLDLGPGSAVRTHEPHVYDLFSMLYVFPSAYLRLPVTLLFVSLQNECALIQIDAEKSESSQTKFSP